MTHFPPTVESSEQLSQLNLPLRLRFSLRLYQISTSSSNHPFFLFPANPLRGNFHHEICFLERPQAQMVLGIIWWNRDRLLELSYLLLAGNDPITGRNIDRPGYKVVIVKMLASGGTLGGGIVLAGLTYQVCERCRVKCG